MTPTGPNTRRALESFGWSQDADGLVTHPRCAFPWPAGDAIRLEEEWQAGDRSARRILGSVKVRAAAAKPKGNFLEVEERRSA